MTLFIAFEMKPKRLYPCQNSLRGAFDFTFTFMADFSESKRNYHSLTLMQLAVRNMGIARYLTFW